MPGGCFIENTIKDPQRYAVQECDATMLPNAAASFGQKNNTHFFLTTRYNKNLELIFLNALTINYKRQKMNSSFIIHHSSFII